MADMSRPPHFVITAEGSVLGEDTAENREIVRRIHACVNACEGLSTEELENGIIQDMRRVISQVIPLLEQRRELQRKLEQYESGRPAVELKVTAPEPDATDAETAGDTVADGEQCDA